MAIDLNKEQLRLIGQNIEKNGIDECILKEAKNVYNTSYAQALRFDSSRSPCTHVLPQTIAYIMTLFENSFSQMKFLDLGCGMGEGVTSYTPVLSIAMKNLGAEVYAIDFFPDRKNKFKDLGIHYSSCDLNKWLLREMRFQELKGREEEFFSNNDFVAARSFLNGGLAQSFTSCYGNVSASYGFPDEYDFYKKIISKVARSNEKSAVYELDAHIHKRHIDWCYSDFGLLPLEERKTLMKKDFGDSVCGPIRNHYDHAFVFIDK